MVSTDLIHLIYVQPYYWLPSGSLSFHPTSFSRCCNSSLAPDDWDPWWSSYKRKVCKNNCCSVNFSRSDLRENHSPINMIFPHRPSYSRIRNTAIILGIFSCEGTACSRSLFDGREVYTGYLCSVREMFLVHLSISVHYRSQGRIFIEY